MDMIIQKELVILLGPTTYQVLLGQALLLSKTQTPLMTKHGFDMSKILWARQDSNLGPTTYKIVALPLSYAPKIFVTRVVLYNAKGSAKLCLPLKLNAQVRLLYQSTS